MKNKNNIIMIGLLLWSMNIAVAQKGVDLLLKVDDRNTFGLNFDNPEHTDIQVEIKDLEGVTLFKEVYVGSGGNLKYNLKGLPRGEYVLVLKYDDLIQMQPITKSRNELVIDQGKRLTVFPPQIDQSIGYLDVMIDCPTGLSVYLELEDDFGHRLYGRYEKPQEQIQKRFNLKQLGDGQYHFSLAIEGAGLDHRYTESILLSSNDH